MPARSSAERQTRSPSASYQCGVAARAEPRAGRVGVAARAVGVERDDAPLGQPAEPTLDGQRAAVGFLHAGDERVHAGRVAAAREDRDHSGGNCSSTHSGGELRAPVGAPVDQHVVARAQVHRKIALDRVPVVVLT